MENKSHSRDIDRYCVKTYLFYVQAKGILHEDKVIYLKQFIIALTFVLCSHAKTNESLKNGTTRNNAT